MPKAQVPGIPAAVPIRQVPGGLSITVRRFVFEGNTLLEPLVLEKAVASYVGQSLNFSGQQHVR
jgi:hemolysin activation/secretion protein